MTARALPGWSLLIGGILGATASAVLIVERFHLLEDPDASLACDLGVFVACAPVMSSPAASIFGFPNPLFGIVCFVVAATTGVVHLAGSALPRWYWRALSVALLLAAALITFLQFQSIVVIGSLCIWCMLVWAATIPIVVNVLGYSLAHAVVAGAARRQFGRWVLRYRVSIIAIWYLLILAAIAATFGRELLGS